MSFKMDGIILKNHNKPFFSIIVPIFNVNLDYFEKCLNSILNQDYEDFEVILVDDGSNQTCADACDSFLVKDSRIKVIHQENKGVSVARNHGIEVSSADWVMFVDADDWLELNALTVLHSKLTRTNCDILLFNGIREYLGYQKSMNYGIVNGTLYNTDDIETKEMLYKRIMGVQNQKSGRLCVVYYSWDKVYRRSFLIENDLKFPDGISKSEDKVFILRCIEKAKKIYYIDNVLYHYRINDASVCHRYTENADQDRINLAKLLEEIAKRMDRELATLKEEPEYSCIMDEFNRFCFGIITDVMKLKYFHKDYPRTDKERQVELKDFLKINLFKDAITKVKYSTLPFDAKIKKFLLSHGMANVFYFMKSNKSKF